MSLVTDEARSSENCGGSAIPRSLITRPFGSSGKFWQAHTHFCPARIGTDHFDIATMRSSEFPRDAQAKSMPGHARAAAHPVKTVEQQVGAVLGNGIARVADCHFHIAINGSRFDADAAARSVIFNGVFDEILRDHPDECGIGL